MSTLYVNNIEEKDSGSKITLGNTLKVDSIEPKTTGGIINIPTTIAFDVSKTHSSAGGSNQLAVFNHVTTNIGNAYDTSTGRFTAPIAGTYEFTHNGIGAGNTSGSGLGAGNTVQMFFRKNGSVTNTTKYGRVNCSITSSTSYPSISASVILTLAQGDYIEVIYDAYFMYFDIQIYNNFTGKLIGV